MNQTQSSGLLFLTRRIGPQWAHGWQNACIHKRMYKGWCVMVMRPLTDFLLISKLYICMFSPLNIHLEVGKVMVHFLYYAFSFSARD